jgi:hypothetical protein
MNARRKLATILPPMAGYSQRTSLRKAGLPE